MKLLITSGKFLNYLVPNFYNLVCEVRKLADVEVWHESGNIKDILKQIRFTPDVIFINEFGESNSPQITGLDDIDIPYVLLMYDLHYQFEIRNKALESLHPQLIFTLYRDSFKRFYPDYIDKMHWFPHHIDIETFKDYELSKEINYLMMGETIPRVYPLRHKIWLQMQHEPGFIYHAHPGWRVFTEEDRKQLYIGEKYAREINRAKIFFTCDSIYRYPLLKYFEVPACNTLLLAPSSPELIDLGFIPETNFVEINENDFATKAAYYLDNEGERLKIARQGYEMVRISHSTVKRAHDLVNTLTQLIPGH